MPPWTRSMVLLPLPVAAAPEPMPSLLLSEARGLAMFPPPPPPQPSAKRQARTAAVMVRDANGLMNRRMIGPPSLAQRADISLALENFHPLGGDAVAIGDHLRQRLGGIPLGGGVFGRVGADAFR